MKPKPIDVKTVRVDSRKLWMSRKEAAAYLGVSKEWLIAREMAGVLSVSKVANTFFYIKAQIDNMIREGAVIGVNKFRETR